MVKLNQLALSIACAASPLALVSGGCSASLPVTDGACAVAAAIDCTIKADAASPAANVGLVGYSCTGTARPDQNARYIDDVPRGIVCADRGVGADGKQNYCCTAETTNCAYDPVASCVSGTQGIQCRGASRPDVFNAALTCEQGVRDDIYINYCCTGQKPPPECTQKTGRCSGEYTGFNCPSGTTPLGSDLKSSESHADNYHFLCQTPQIAADGKTYDYCCYQAAPLPEGSSCLGDTSVPGCAIGRFGFACTGVDRPEQSYLPMKCSEPGFPGKSLEGYSATLYCCDHK